MFSGEYAHTLDAKGRLTLPARLREELLHGLAITRGYEPCLTIYPWMMWQDLARKAADLPTTNASVRSFNRLVYSRAFEIIPDRLGRILIPGVLRQHAGIETDTIIIGANTYLEVWSPERWRERYKLDAENESSILVDIGQLGIVL